MDTQNPKQQLLERLKTANNVLVTVSSSPSVDQLAACIGLTLILNKQGKHATAVFSGEVPSTLEFLEPEATLEKNTDSLRDFIISLDKSKADKLRYKVEDTVVKIFITPYRTSLSADDLEYSQGDFNVDLVLALGVKEQQDLDNAITAHGRILHDAAVATVNTNQDANLGTINWHDAAASSLCELVADLARELGKDLLDNQISTALLTGIVAETARFSNEKTTPQTMSVSAELMSNGANQQLVASKLEGPSVDLHDDKKESEKEGVPAEGAASGDDAEPSRNEPPAKQDDGTLEITHPHDDEASSNDQAVEEPQPEVAPTGQATEPKAPGEGAPEPTSHVANEDRVPKIVTEPPQLGGTLTANSSPESYDPTTDPLSLPSVEDQPMLSHDTPMANPAPAPEEVPPPAVAAEPTTPAATPPAPAWTPPAWIPPTPPAVDVPPAQPAEPPAAPPVSKTEETLAELEQEVRSEEATDTETTDAGLDAARDEVLNALNSAPAPAQPPVEALNANPVDLNKDSAPETPSQPPSLAFDPSAFGVMNDPDVPATAATPEPTQDFSSPLGQSMTMPLPPTMPPPPAAAPTVTDPTAPPPVPPPLPFQFGPQNNQNQQ